jgi:hypothetical protein
VIRTHETNTRWWGAPAGIVDDAAFFTQPDIERQQALAAYQWVEFKSDLGAAPPLAAIARAGFFLADTQVAFRIALRDADGTCAEQLTVRFAGESGFQCRAEDLAPFDRERYIHLPGLTQERLNERYANWGSQLIRDHPETCLAVLSGEQVQGWFLSQPAPGGLNLTLAATHRHARVSGFLLYQKSLAAYAAKGHRVGFAGFSVRNTAVHNIYAKLGARFTAPFGIWLWISPGANRSDAPANS